MGKLWTSPDTMAVLVLREKYVTALSRPVFACGAKNRCRPIELKINMGKLWTSPDTMAMMNLREIHDLALWTWFCGHAQKRKNEKYERQSRGSREAVGRSVRFVAKCGVKRGVVRPSVA